MSSPNCEQYITSQPSSPQYTPMEVERNSPDLDPSSSENLAPSTPPTYSDQTTSSIVTVEDVLSMDCDSLCSANVFNSEAEYIPTYARFNDCPDAFDVDEASFLQFLGELDDPKEWYRQNSWAYHLGFPHPEDPSESSSGGYQPPHDPIYPEMLDNLPDQTSQMNSLLGQAWLRRPPPPPPEPSIFRNLEPYDTYGLPPECFMLKKPDKEAEAED